MIEMLFETVGSLCHRYKSLTVSDLMKEKNRISWNRLLYFEGARNFHVLKCGLPSQILLTQSALTSRNELRSRVTQGHMDKMGTGTCYQDT